MRYVSTSDEPEGKSREYMALSKSDHDELARVIPEFEKSGWELFAITQSSVTTRGAAATTYTAWLRK